MGNMCDVSREVVVVLLILVVVNAVIYTNLITLLTGADASIRVSTAPCLLLSAGKKMRGCEINP